MKYIPLATLLLSLPAGAQSFQDAPTRVPQGSPFNNSFSENVDFADVDGDGDWDAVFADGGTAGNDRNRIWINQGGLQGGTTGVFVDKTGARFPTGGDDSRDIEFADIDSDGDPDLYISNTSHILAQSNRWWINQGGIQGGSAGFFVDETLTRYLNLGVNNGTTILSSVAPSVLLSSGGYINYSCDSDFADMNSDGHIDLVLSSYGGVAGGNKPSRIFLNDGHGQFEEFNPSGYRLTSENIFPGEPGLWCQGTQLDETTNTTGATCDIATTALDVELADADGDLDIDILLGARNEEPRYFQNRLEESGGLTFQDKTHAVFQAGYNANAGHYEQEFGDLDGDNDVDIYGANWLVGSQLHDSLLLNDGNGNFSSQGVLPSSSNDHHEADFIDLECDGDLDVIAATFAGPENSFLNNGNGVLTNNTGSQLPSDTSKSLDVEVCDLDGDGDFDLMVANDDTEANVLLNNMSDIADTHAPRVVKLEAAPDRTSSAVPTVIRVHVYDNVPMYLLWYSATTLQYSVNGGPWIPTPMKSMGGQLFRGEIPGSLVGAISYRVRCVDDHGNAGLSNTRSYVATSGCGTSVAYCTAGQSASGCQANLSTSGTPSLSQASGFVINTFGIEGSKDGMFFYGFQGGQANTWGNGTSFQCVAPPVKRTPLLPGLGSPGTCNGAFSRDFNRFWFSSGPAKSPAPGQLVSVQLWYRDSQNTSNQTTSLSDAVQFSVCP